MSRTFSLQLLAAVALGLGVLSGCAAQGDSHNNPVSGAEWAENLISCLAEFGWEAREQPDGGLLADVPTNRGDAYEEDFAKCESRFGYDQPPAPLSSSQAEELFARVGVTADCLIARGFDVGVRPSKRAFVDAVTSGEGGWDPYVEIYGPGKMDESEYFAVLRDCPRTW